MSKVISLLGISTNSIYYKKRGYGKKTHRKALSDGQMISVRDLNLSYGWGYMMITAYLKRRGKEVSYRQVYSFMKKEGICARKPKRSDYSFNHKRIEADSPRQIVQTDFVRLYINGIWIYVFKDIDIFNREAVAYEASPFSGSVTSLKVLRSLYDVCDSFPIKLIQDNGSCYIASSYQSLAKGLNISLEYIKAHTPEHNGVVERSFKTDTYEGLASHYLTCDNLDNILKEWFYFYNTQRPHSTNRYKTPKEKLDIYLKNNPMRSLKQNPINNPRGITEYVKIPVKAI